MILFQRAGRVLAGLTGVVLGGYLLVAYVLLPAGWRHYEHHPRLATFPKVTVNADGIPGGPLNVGLIGTQDELMAAFHAAGWRRADPLGLVSDLDIAASVVLDRPDPTAPVSPLYLWGRPEDRAFEKPVGPSARERQHVRFWRTEETGRDGRPVWIGAASFDQGVGFSHLTGQITHPIAPDIDAERDRLLADLAAAGRLQSTYQVTGVGPTLNGRNAEGDRYFTDGELTVGVLAPAPAPPAAPVVHLPNPPAVSLKNAVWSWLRPALTRWHRRE